MPVSTVFDKLKEYEKRFIKRHTALIDFSKMGFDVRVNIAIKAGQLKRAELQRFVTKSQHVNSVYKVSNDYDFMVEAIFANHKELQEFLDRVDELAMNRKEFFIAEDLKREEFMASRNLVDLL
jgi:DNA-binding Lrp family transcriptional regulator